MSQLICGDCCTPMMLIDVHHWLLKLIIMFVINMSSFGNHVHLIDDQFLKLTVIKCWEEEKKSLHAARRHDVSVRTRRRRPVSPCSTETPQCVHGTETRSYVFVGAYRDTRTCLHMETNFFFFFITVRYIFSQNN